MTTVPTASMPPRPTIAFDLDGTLVDTAPDLLGALNFVLGEIGLSPLGEDQVRSLVGGGARVMIERGLTFHGMDPQPAEVDRMLADFLRSTSVTLPTSRALFPEPPRHSTGLPPKTPG
jgi:phosphoglycolate phosphatase